MEQDVLSPDYSETNQPTPTVVAQTPPAGNPGVNQPTQQMSPLQLALRGALAGVAAGLGQKTTGQGAAAGANAGVGIAAQAQQDSQAQQQAQREQQDADDRHQMVLANLQLHNIQMMKAQQEVKSGSLDYYTKLADSTKAAVNTSQDSDGFQVFGTGMPEDVVKQKYLEIHQQNPQARVTYGVDGSTTDQNGNIIPTFTLYDPGTGMVKLTADKMQQLKDSGIKVPSNVPADSQVSTTTLNQWRSQSVQQLSMDKAKAETQEAQAHATTAQAQAAVAPQMAKADLASKQQDSALKKSEIVKNMASAAEAQAKTVSEKSKGVTDPVYAYDPVQGRTILTTRSDAQDRSLQGTRKVTEVNIRADAHDSAVLNDISLKSNNLRQAAGAMDDKSWAQAVGVAKYLADNPNTTYEALVRSTAMKNLTSQARAYVIADYSLRESAMGLQKVLTGSARANETQLNALLNTLPGVEPNSQIVGQKLDAFEQNIGTLRKMLPILPGMQEVQTGGQQQQPQQAGAFNWNAHPQVK
jgi:hypothetical protein